MTGQDQLFATVLSFACASMQYERHTDPIKCKILLKCMDCCPRLMSRLFF